MNPRVLRFVVTAGALAAALVHLVWPHLSIDAVTLGLVVIAVIPWLAPLFRSLELPGGWKVEFRELREVTERADQAGLVAREAAPPPAEEFSFQTVASTDPNLALAGLRIEIEKRLTQLAASRGISVERRGINQLLRDLNGRELINAAERSVLSDLTSLLNSAVHGATVEMPALDWAMDVGPRILHALDNRIASEDVQYRGIS